MEFKQFDIILLSMCRNFD